jgi:hypothetical protein
MSAARRCLLSALLLGLALVTAPGARPQRPAAAAPGAGGRTELAATGWATLKGKVTYDGEPPEPADLTDQMAGNKDRDYCLKGDTEDPTWVVGPDGGVANVVVWLRPPRGKFFPVPDGMKKRSDIVTMDQPFCAFKPHGVILFPSYWDPAAGEEKPTGQVFKVLNSAAVAHNVLWSGNPVNNPGENVLLASTRPGDKVTERVLPVRTGRAGQEELIRINCNLHLWMRGWAWAFEHPYAALTGKDGTFEIPRVPAGVDLSLAAWHEGANPPWLLPAGAGKREGVALAPLADGEVHVFDFKVRKR